MVNWLRQFGGKKADRSRYLHRIASSWSWFSFPLQPSHLLLQFMHNAHRQWSYFLICEILKNKSKLIGRKLTNLEILLVLLPLDLDFLFLCNLRISFCNLCIMLIVNDLNFWLVKFWKTRAELAPQSGARSGARVFNS